MIPHVLNNLLKKSLGNFAPPSTERVSEWAHKNRMKSKESSSIGGRWRDRAWQTEIQDCWTDPDVEEIILMKAVQVGATDMLLNMIGYSVDQDPSGILIVVPTQGDIALFSKTRLDPMIRDCKPLKNKLTDKKTADNTQALKLFPDGYLRIVGAKTPREVSSMPLPRVVFDEVDKYTPTIEGDVITLGLERIKEQENRKALIQSSPGEATRSRIYPLYMASDQRCFYLRCIHCGNYAVLMFKHLKWDKIENKSGKKEHRPETAYYPCKKCGTIITDADRYKMLERGGEWRPTQASPYPKRRGYRISEFYSPNRTFAEIAHKFVDRKDDPTRLQVFINGTLGEVYNLPCDKLEKENLQARVEEYYHEDEPLLPQGGAILTAGVDIQKDRIEATVRLWGTGEESWGIEYHVFRGDPYQSIVWDRLEELVNKKYTHASGVKLKIECCAVDAGYATDQVYKYVGKKGWPVVAIMGRGGVGEPLARKSTKIDKSKVPLTHVGVHTAKNTLFNRSHIDRLSGPGVIRWNQNFNTQYFEQFTAEKRITKKVAGVDTDYWFKPSGLDNEAWDCEVYAYAALWIAGIPDLKKRVDQLKPTALKEKKEKLEKKKAAFQKKLKNRGGWKV